MARRTLPATIPAAARYVAMLAVMLAVVPVEVRTCDSSDVLPAGATFSSPALVVDLGGCRHLDLDDNTIGDSGAAAIADALKINTALTELTLHNNTIGDSGAAAIADALKSNTALTYLDLDDNTIVDSGAAALAEALKSNTALATLRLAYNNIGDSGAAAIADALKINTALTYLNLDNNPGISNAAQQLITGYLAKNEVVKEIRSGRTSVYESYAYINDIGAAAIAEALKNNTAFTTLTLHNNNIGDSGAAALAEALKSNTALTNLGLDNNPIGDSGAAALAEALKSNTALATLRLAYNNIGDSSAAAIADALKINTALRQLDLDYNNVGDIGATAVAEALEVNTELTTLTLGSNSIGDSGAAAIAEALKNNTALTYLRLSSNNIGDSGAAALVEMLEINTVLAMLNLNYNNITCSNHGTQRNGNNDKEPNIAEGDRICDCSGFWGGDFCDTASPFKILLTVLSVSALAVLAWVVVQLAVEACVDNRKCIRAFRARKQAKRQRKQEERAFGIAHPISVTTLGGDAYTLNDWGHCKDLKLALQKLAPPGELGDPSTFVLLDNDGWTAPPGGGGGSAASSVIINATATEVDTKYGSTHRANMMQSAPNAARGGSGIIELTLVYKANCGGGGGGSKLGRVVPVDALAEEMPAQKMTTNNVSEI